MNEPKPESESLANSRCHEEVSTSEGSSGIEGSSAKWSEVHRQEEARIRRRRSVAFGNGLPGATHDQENRSDPPLKDVVGLALSGGGLRSAMFNDGFLQGLSHRGLLRYVDYLCSVSGGGYIASHLLTHGQTTNANTAKNFHTDESIDAADKTAKMPDWYFGRDPVTGRNDPERMKGVGRYLTGIASAFPSYAISMVTNACCYLGGMGMVATLIALFWRSFDDPIFRYMHGQVLGFRWGGELAIAFYPAILMGMATLLVLTMRCTVKAIAEDRWLFHSSSAFWNRCRSAAESLVEFSDKIFKAFVLGCLVAILVSVLIFAGNGITEYSGDGGQPLYLNRFAQTLALIAGVIQVLAFLGRDKLFRSERDEAKRWQRHMQTAATFGVIVVVGSAMVHWMGREDISRFTRLREPYLVRGDVQNWNHLEVLFESYSSPSDTDDSTEADSNLSLVDILEPGTLLPRDRWQHHLLEGGLTDPGGRNATRWHLSSTAQPKSPLFDESEKKKWPTDFERHWGLVKAYVYSQWPKPNLEGQSESEPRAVSFNVEHLWRQTHSLFRRREEKLSKWNKELQEPEFSAHLIDVYQRSIQEASLSEGAKLFFMRENSELLDWLNGIVQQNDTNLDSDLVVRLQAVLSNEFSRHELAISQSSVDASDRDSEDHRDHRDDREIAAVNRELINWVLPGTLRSLDLASTPVVASHDQAARRQMLLVWLWVLTVGLLMNQCNTLFPTVYKYYRKRICRFFLRAQEDGDDGGNRTLADFRPTDFGLPHPLMLACRMDPQKVNDSYAVLSKPFVLSPLYCGDAGSEKAIFDPRQLALSSSSHPVAVADAVTLSGAAVTPLMTHNRSLSVLLNFFGTGLGRFLMKRPVDGESVSQHANQKWAVRLLNSHIRLSPLLSLILLILLAVSIANESVPTTWVVSGAAILCSTWALTFQTGIVLVLKAILMPGSSDRHPKGHHVVGHIADGGFVDYLGATELLRRRCSVVIVSDAGAHLNGQSLAPLARLCRDASTDLGIQFLDLDHESPVDSKRLALDGDKFAHQPYLLARIRYPDRAEPGLLVYCQMAISRQDPLEIQQIRYRFPSFPDEPTTNQFYTNEQVAAYRTLGYHIANRMCSEMNRWTLDDVRFARRIDDQASGGHDMTSETLAAGRQPRMDTIVDRMKTSYRLACYQESGYRDDDVFREAIWSTSTPVDFGDFPGQMAELIQEMDEPLVDALSGETPKGPRRDQVTAQLSVLVDRWLSIYQRDADLRARYRHAVVTDVNSIDSSFHQQTAALFGRLSSESMHHPGQVFVMACHLTTLAVACHEIHFGRPNAIFQVGGRAKLVSLAVSMALELTPTLDPDTSPSGQRASESNRVFHAIQAIVCELFEMRKCTFIGGEHLTVISFAQCMTMMWGQLSRQQSTHPTEPLSEPVRRLVRETLKNGRDVAVANLRIGIDEATNGHDMTGLIRILQKAWCISMFPEGGSDASQSSSDSSLLGVDQS